jgi:hypothetical protein
LLRPRSRATRAATGSQSSDYSAPVFLTVSRADLPPLHLRRGSYPASTGLIPFIKSGATEGLLPVGLSGEGVVCFHVSGAPDGWKTVFLCGIAAGGKTFEAHSL